VAASPMDVWRYRLDFTNLPAYNPDVTDLERTQRGGEPDGLGPGARYAFNLSGPQGPHPVTLTVTSMDEGREVAATMNGALEARETFVVEAAPGGGSSVTLTLFLELASGMPDGTRAALLEHGRLQIRKELDAIVAVFERG
jgi:Polyketide cyclase / dehydrase and lipid transport